MDCSQLGFSVHGISQARILEWVAISFSRGSSWPGDWIHVFYIGRSILHHWATREALRNQIQDQTEFEFSAHWGWSGPNPQIRLKPVNWTVESRTWRKKKGRIGEVEKRKGRRRGKEVDKVSYFFPIRVLCIRRPGTRVSVVAAGSGPLVGQLVPKSG